MQTVVTSGPRAQLPARAARTHQIRCAAAPQRQQASASPQRAEQAAPEPSAATALALSSLLLGAAPAWAEEAAEEVAAAATGSFAEEAAAAATGSFAPLGVTPVGWTLVLSPVLFYGLFNLYRSVIDPKAKFGDAVFIFAAAIILANIVCITVFKIRLF